MDTEARFASLDSTALNGDFSDVCRQPSTIARRSASIFSRRGTATPEPKPPFIAQAAMRAPKAMSDRQKRWSRRKSASFEASPKSKGTILNLVPQAKVIHMTPLEEEMATSPNDEILSAISGTPTTPITFAWPTPSQEQMNSLWNQTHAPLAQRAQSVRSKDSTTRVGVWRKGVAHWDDEALRPNVCSSNVDMQAATGLTPMRRVPTSRLNRTHTQKPTLSVVIPSGEPLVNDLTLSTIFQSTSQRPVFAMAPASMVPSTLADLTTSIRETQKLIAHPSPPPSPIRPPISKFRASSEASLGIKSTKTPGRRHLSSSSSSSSFEDGDSCCSRKSSATSLDTLAAEVTPPRLDRSAASSSTLNGSSEPSIGIAKSSTNETEKSLPISAPIREDLRLPPSTGFFQKIRSTSVRSSSDAYTGIPLLAKQVKPSASLSRLDLLERKFSTPDALYASCQSTPTLSRAEDDVEVHLSNLSSPELVQRAHSTTSSTAPQLLLANELIEDASETGSLYSKSGSVHRHGSVHSVMQPPENAPTIPKRSRKREWRVGQNNRKAIQLSIRTARRRKSEGNLKPDSVPALHRSSSATEPSHLTDVAEFHCAPMENLRPSAPQMVFDEGLVVLTGPVKVHAASHSEATVSSSAAEDVLLHILASLHTTADLFNTARINRGMYRVFKENEMDLIQTVTHNHSPPAWEFREWCPPTANTPKSYMDAYHRDMVTIEALKRLILERCQTVIRRETALALSTPTHLNAQRFNDAIWRIWCFCAIFGSGKSREEDVTGQLDWLKGGLLATNQDLTATMNMNLDYDMISVLLNPPEYFAKGNNGCGGLSAQQLYDMMEIFTCMKTLLEGYHYRTEQAWVHGIFNECGIGIGDDETEAQLLEEWTAYLLTLGPKVVLEMAELAHNSSSAGFALAQLNGWTQWTPPAHGGSRQDFLKEPLSRLYEERVAAAAQRVEDPREKEKKEMSRRRVATLAAEIKLARQASSFRRRPYIDQSMERSMSAFSRRNSTASTVSLQTETSTPPTAAAARRRTAPSHPPPKRPPPNFSKPRTVSSPRSTLWLPREISPIIEDRVETFNRLSLLNFGTGVAEDTVGRAVGRIVDMGFSAAQATQALMMTDSGDGLRVDRAVELLLRQQWAS